MARIVHKLDGEGLPEGEVAQVRTRCGRTIDHPVVTVSAARYDLVAQNGNLFFCTARPAAVTCLKCKGAIDVRPSRAAVAEKRTVAHASAAAARAARPHARPQRAP